MVLAKQPGLPPAAVAQRLGLDRARTSRAITSLLNKQMVTRRTMPGDRRQARLSLTPAGRAVHDDLFPQVKALNQDLLSQLTPEALRGLDHALSTMQQQAQALVATRTDLPRAYRLRGDRQ